MKYPAKILKPPTTFNFDPKCQMHLRNLRVTYKQAITSQEEPAKSSAPKRTSNFAEYAAVALVTLDSEIAANKFINLPECV